MSAQKSVQKSVLILDAGNSIIEAKIARRERGEVAFYRDATSILFMGSG